MEEQKLPPKAAVQKELNAYKELNRLNKSGEFDVYVETIIKLCTLKMVDAFIGDKVETLEDFLALKGEVSGLLLPIQDVRSADALQKKLQENLNDWYSTPR
jgi:hypothetical protein